MKDLTPYLKRIALETGVLGGSHNYVKFIILSRSRTGSVYLRSLLNSHSQINVFGELFQKHNEINWNFTNIYRSKRERLIFQKDPVLFLEKEIFRKHPRYIMAVGFKIFYYHAQNDNWGSVWNYLQNQRDLKIIHLKRGNILKTHLSKVRADRSGKWVNLTGEKEEFEPLTLSFGECRDDFIRTRKWENGYDTIFENHHKLDTYYEDLCDDSKNELHRIQEFLNVDEEDLQSNTYRQNTQPLSQTIANYLELKEQFKGTPWSEFFDE